MSVYSDWQKNHEQRRILQAAIYDVVLAEPHKPYYDISNEFDISVQSAKNLLKEYCEALNIENPKRKGFSEKEKDPTEIAKNSRNKKRALKEISDEMIINGKNCVVKKEYDKTLIVIFEDEYEPVMVVKKTHEEIRKKNNHDYNNPKRGRKYATY